MKGKTKAVSLHDELLEVALLFDGIRILAHLAAVDGFDQEGESRRAPQVVEAISSIARGRLELVCRCLRREADPRLLLAPHNDATNAQPPEGWTDILLQAWEGLPRRSEPGKRR